jgi:hypothetical protein
MRPDLMTVQTPSGLGVIEGEVWAKVPGLPTLLVSSLGRVYEDARPISAAAAIRNNTLGSYTVSKHVRVIPARLVKTKEVNGYKTVSLASGGRGKTYRVHRLVACAFLGESMDSPLDINHKDGARDNNRVENLEWCTRSYNIRDSYARGRKSATLGLFGAKHPRASAVKSVDLATGEEVHYASMADAGRAGFSVSKVSTCVSGKRKTHKGKSWAAVGKEVAAGKETILKEASNG